MTSRLFQHEVCPTWFHGARRYAIVRDILPGVQRAGNGVKTHLPGPAASAGLVFPEGAARGLGLALACAVLFWALVVFTLGLLAWHYAR